MHLGRLELTRISRIAEARRDKDEHAAMVSSVLLSQEHDLTCATGTTTKEKENGTVESTLGR